MHDSKYTLKTLIALPIIILVFSILLPFRSASAWGFGGFFSGFSNFVSSIVCTIFGCSSGGGGGGGSKGFVTSATGGLIKDAISPTPAPPASAPAGGSSPPPAPTCTPSYFCTGSDLYHKDASCADSLSSHCQYGCSGSACLQPPAASFDSFDAIYQSAHSSTTTTFTATGHLQARPSLVQTGDVAQLYWNVSNVNSCSVNGNGDSWTGSFSGTTGKNTSAINGQTTYTLSCMGLAGATPASISETQTINIVPIFQEI